MKIGIIGTGRIAERFIHESVYVSDVVVSAVYNPNLNSAKYFVETHFGNTCDGNNAFGANIPIATDRLNEFISVVDSAYVASPHETHVEYIKALLMSGKHVLCEKPMSFAMEDTIELYRLAKERKLILMEAIKTAYCPGFNGLLEIVNKGVIGPVRDVEACFTKIGSVAGREMFGRYPGSFYELGSYTLLPIVKILGSESLESYIWTLDSATGADAYAKCVISYESGVATAKTGLGVKSEGELIVAGENGYIRVPSPWWLTSKVEVHYENPNQVEVYEYPYEESGLRYEIKAFAERIAFLNQMKSIYDEKDDVLYDVWEEIQNGEGVTPNESVWLSAQMEYFGIYVNDRKEQGRGRCLGISKENVRIWAHRGCSMTYPENTLVAFEAAANIPGITGIELDTQLTKDGEIVVIHDEKLDRTTNLSGYVADYSLADIKKCQITGSGNNEICYIHEGKPSLKRESDSDTPITVPTLREVFELLRPFCLKNGLFINIELKNSIVPYDGMEPKIIELVKEFGLEEYIIYSSFNHESMRLIKNINASARTAALGVAIKDCLKGMKEYGLDAVHPGRVGMDINEDTATELINNNIPVRMWNSDEPFYGQQKPLRSIDYTEYAAFGVTDVFTNVPEKY